VLDEVLPAIRCAHESARTLQPGSRRGQGEGVAGPPGKQHRHSAMLAEPGRVAGPPVAQVRRQEHVKVIRVKRRRIPREEDHLNDRLVTRMRQHRLLDAVPPLAAGVDQPIQWNSRVRIFETVFTTGPLIREELAAVGDDQPEVARAGQVHAGIEDLGEDALSDREPDVARGAAGRVERHPDAILGRRCPARLGSGPPRGRAGFAGMVRPRRQTPVENGISGHGQKRGSPLVTHVQWFVRMTRHRRFSSRQIRMSASPDCSSISL
jgi:hypothetical protein